jgi:WD40 repeat protein
LQGHTDNVTSVAFSPDGMYVASGSLDTTVCVWDTQTGNLWAQFQGHSDSVRSVAFSRNGRWIVSGSRDHSVRIWDIGASLAPRNAARCLTGHLSWVWAVAVGKGEREGQEDGWIVSGSWDKTVRIWRLDTLDTVTTLLPAEGPLAKEHSLLSIAVSPIGDRIVAGSYGGTIYIWRRE